MAMANEYHDIVKMDQLAQHLLENPMGDSLLHRLKKGARLIKKMGDLLDLDDLVIDTAVVYLRRYFSLKTNVSEDVNGMTPSCLFLVTKDGSSCRDASSIAQAAHYCQCDKPLGKNKEFKKTSEVMKFEGILVEFLGCHLNNVDLPHSHIDNFLKGRKIDEVSRVLLIVVTRLVVRETNFCILYPAKIVTSFCIIFVYYWRNLEPPSDTNEVHWSEDYNTTYSKMIKTFTSCLLQRFELNFTFKFFSLRNNAQKRKSFAPVSRTKNNSLNETKNENEMDISPARGADNFLQYFHDRTLRKNSESNHCTKVNKFVDDKPVGYIDDILNIETPSWKRINANEFDDNASCRTNTNVQIENIGPSRTNYIPEISQQQPESTEYISRMRHNLHNGAHEYFVENPNLTNKMYSRQVHLNHEANKTKNCIESNRYLPYRSNAKYEKNIETYLDNEKTRCQLKNNVHSFPEVDLPLPGRSNDIPEANRNLPARIHNCIELERSLPDGTNKYLEEENISDGGTNDYFQNIQSITSRNHDYIESVYNRPSARTNIYNDYFDEVRNLYSRHDDYVGGMYNSLTRYHDCNGGEYGRPNRNDEYYGGDYDGHDRYHDCNGGVYDELDRYHDCIGGEYDGHDRYYDCNGTECGGLDSNDEFSNISTGTNNYCGGGVNKASSETNNKLEMDHNISDETEYYYGVRSNQTSRTDDYFEPERNLPSKTNGYCEENNTPRETNAYLEEGNNMLSETNINNFNEENNLPRRNHQ